MLIVRLARLTYQLVPPLFLQKRETMTKMQLTVWAAVMGGRDTHYHKDTLHPTHQNLPFKLTQSCQLWWAHHQKRHWQKILNETGSRITLHVLWTHCIPWQYLTLNLINSGSLFSTSCKRNKICNIHKINVSCFFNFVFDDVVSHY